MTDGPDKKRLTYAEAGVDIDAGDEAVSRIRKLAAATCGPEVLSEIGSFGGLFKPNLTGINKPVLISSTDSVGTKLKLAFMTGNHTTVGRDLVNHCVDDILVHGARPLFFLDYIAVEHLDPAIVADLVGGLSQACQENGVALLGGETAELPDFYQPGEYDVAGFIVGVVDEERIINGRAIRDGDVCIGLPSTGLHTNGFTLARKVFFEVAGLQPESDVSELGTTAAEALMTVHRSYLKIVHEIMPECELHGMAHITGGGIAGNLQRVLPRDVDAVIERGSWPVLPVFDYLQRAGDIDVEEMYRAFNMGVGYILVTDKRGSECVFEVLEKHGEKGHTIGRIVSGSGSVRFTG